MTLEKALWSASKQEKEKSQMQAFLKFAEKRNGKKFADYFALHQWSIDDLGAFWETLSLFFQIEFRQPYQKVFNPALPFYKSQWFLNSKLSYTHHIERQFRPNETALIYGSERHPTIHISWNALFKRAKQLKYNLQAKGIKQGDVVGGYLRHHPDSIAAFLAVNSIGAVWSCCAPEFGAESVIQRFQQLQPKLLFVHDHYMHKGKRYNLTQNILSLEEKLHPKPHIVCFDASLEKWDLTTQETHSLEAVAVDFDHPIWVLFSSGTTGHPKAITHRTGGMLLEQLKALCLHQEVCPRERFFWNTTTGWMMWNYALGSLLCGATLAIYDGATDLPTHWLFAQEEKLHHFGHGAPFFTASAKENIDLNKENFSTLKTIGSTGAPLSKDSFYWLQKSLPQAHLISLSGGTDVCSAFLGGNILLDVYAGYLQCAMLGAAVVALDNKGSKINGQTGELALAKPMPCMPLYFWGDRNNKSYHSAYFEKFEGVWCHGDWVMQDTEKGFQILGRADATLNRQGIRIGTAEIYHALFQNQVVPDALIVEIAHNANNSELYLFVALNEELTSKIEQDILQCIREHCSPRHLPDKILRVPEIPYTLSGKRMELPVKKILEGKTDAFGVSLGSMKNPKAIDAFVSWHKKLNHP